jgi:hypothetical protein
MAPTYEELDRRVRRLDMDLLAYGRHLPTCGGPLQRDPSPKLRRLAYRCTCGYHDAIRFRTQGAWPDLRNEEART